MNCNTNELEAYIFHGLTSLLTEGDTLPPRYLEMIVCSAFNLTHVGDGNFYADGVGPGIQASIKTRMMVPDILKSKAGRDFSTHPDKFLGIRRNKKHGIQWAGLEFVQRRQEIANESSLSATQIGRRTLVGFLRNIEESKKKFNVDKTYEILLAHGYNWKMNKYLVNLYWQELEVPNLKTVTWAKNHNGVDGLINNQIVMHRVRGGAKRESTCFKEYKDPTKYKHSVSISVPIPERWTFDPVAIQTEIQHLKAQQNGIILFEE
jgi:hypothetical protein